MLDEKLKRVRQLIEKRDQIDEELRALFGEVPRVQRGRRRTERTSPPPISETEPMRLQPRKSDPVTIRSAYMLQ